MDPFVPKEGYGQRIDHHITRLDESRVLKHGPKYSPERDVLQFIAENTTIPVPVPYECRRTEKSLELIMSYMPGKPLPEVWPTLTYEQRLNHCQQLRGYLLQLRKLTSTRIESVNHKPILLGFLGRRFGGPFDTEEELVTFLLGGTYPSITDASKELIQTRLCKGHKIYFTHGDLAPRNILVDDTGHITAILDWEMAGWLPEYWENSRIIYDRPSNMRDHKKFVQHILVKNYDEDIKAFIEYQRWEMPSYLNAFSELFDAYDSLRSRETY